MNREEMLAWAKSLKPGDKVILSDNINFWVLTVEKVTPAGWVRTTNGCTFSQNSWGELLFGRGKSRGHILPVTDDLLQKAKEQGAKRVEDERKRQVIIKARNLIYNESNKLWDMQYDRAAKIVAAFEQINR